MVSDCYYGAGRCRHAFNFWKIAHFSGLIVGRVNSTGGKEKACTKRFSVTEDIF